MNIQGNYNTQFKGRLRIYMGNNKNANDYSLCLSNYTPLNDEYNKQIEKGLGTHFLNDKHTKKGTLHSNGILMDTKNIIDISEVGISYYFPNLDKTEFFEFKKILNNEQYTRLLTAINTADNSTKRTVVFDAIA